MHRNTFFLVLILSVLAALLIGVNIGRKFQPTPEEPVTTASVPTPIPTQKPQETIFTNSLCGISLTLPPGVTVTAEASNSATFVSADTNVIMFACEKEIPRIALPADKMETLKVASMSATLYHTSSPKDGTLFDALIFRNPKTAMDIYLSGLGSTFSGVINSMELMQ